MRDRTDLPNFLRPDRTTAAVAAVLFTLSALVVDALAVSGTWIGFPFPFYLTWIGSCPQGLGVACTGRTAIQPVYFLADIVVWYTVSGLGLAGYRRWNRD